MHLIQRRDGVGEGEYSETYLCDFAKGSAFLTEVDDHSAAAILGLLDGLLDAEDEVGPAGADIGAEDVAPIALSAPTSAQ